MGLPKKMLSFFADLNHVSCQNSMLHVAKMCKNLACDKDQVCREVPSLIDLAAVVLYHPVCQPEQVCPYSRFAGTPHRTRESLVPTSLRVWRIW